MTTTIESPVTTSPAFLSEIFPLNISEPNLICFRLTPEVGKEVGNRFSWRFSQKFPDVVVIWESQCFWVLGKPNQQMPTESHWKKWLEEIQDELRKDIGDRNYSIQWVRQPSVTASVLAELAVRALQSADVSTQTIFYLIIQWSKSIERLNSGQKHLKVKIV